MRATADSLDTLHMFGLRLRALREQAGLSQEALASRAAIHRTYVSSVERGQRNISLINIQALADALGVPITELFTTPEGMRKPFS